MYKLTQLASIIRTTDNASIPADPNNTDYAAYLVWVAAGNVPTPADPVPVQPLTVTPYQIRAALTQAGLRAQAEAFVASSTNQSVKDAWAYAQIFIENDAFITAAASALGQTPAQVHALFQLGGTLAP